MKKIFIIYILFICFTTLTTNASQLNTDKNYVHNFKKESATIANALQLSDEQLEKWQQITEKYNLIYEDNLQTLNEECTKMRVLKQENSSQEAIDNQQKIISNIQNDIQNIQDKELKERKKILNKEQKSKLHMIQKLSKNATKNCQNKNDYYKSNPKMRNFAPKKNNN